MKQEFIRYIGKGMNSSVVRKISSGDVRAMEKPERYRAERGNSLSSSLTPIM